MTDRKPPRRTSPLAVGAAAVAVGIFGTALIFLARPEPKASSPAPTADPLRDIDMEIPGLKASVPRDFIPALWEPEFVAMSEASWDDDEPVIGLAVNGEAKAYPLKILNSHEIANDVIGGIPVAVTW